MEALIARCPRDELNLAVLIAQRIWARRNEMVHEGDFIHPNRLVRESSETLHFFSTPTEEGNVGLNTILQEASVKWEKPPFGRYKVNWDVAIDHNLQYMGFGAIIRDHNGSVCAAKCLKVEGIQEPVVGEAQAALAAVEFSRELGYQDVILEGDSLQVVQALKEEGINWRSYGQIVDDARVLLGTCRSWMVHHMRRGANQAAHSLAKESLWHSSDQIWLHALPDCLFHLVPLELHAHII
ncbi:uncharacterized protein LOC132174476 [Corylus avellana]|uniref:uncharacterized protein LOC132174476 n=1 Tax=Corylus avellana TaxID=13451 RepID=UPI00286D12E1|nr:uncharacterized protein LOC132174476 [Corylus avellana]